MQSVLKHYNNQSIWAHLYQALSEQNQLVFTGLEGSLLSVALACCFSREEQSFLVVCKNRANAESLVADLQSLLPVKSILFFPPLSASFNHDDAADKIQRNKALDALFQRKNVIVVSYPEALLFKIPAPINEKAYKLNISKGMQYPMAEIMQWLFNHEFHRVDFVSQPGDFAIRGGIIDVFSYGNVLPYRIEFFGDTVESLRLFDVKTQRSKEKTKVLTILSNWETLAQDQVHKSLFAFMPAKSTLWLTDTAFITQQLDRLFEVLTDEKQAQKHREEESKKNRPPKQALYLSGEDFAKAIKERPCVHLQKQAHLPELKIESTPQPHFNKRFDVLVENLRQHSQNGFSNLLVSRSAKQAERLKAIFKDLDLTSGFQIILGDWHQGFIDKTHGVLCYTDHQIFDRYHKPRIKNRFEATQVFTLDDLNTLSIGDFVTHIDFGIGRFAGLQKIEVNERLQEAIKLIYQNDDILYVSINALHKISRFSSAQGPVPKLSKLGTPAWKALKSKTHARVKALAINLIKLYAQRKMQKGFAFSPDTYLQTELEASFMYEDTPDQLRATRQVKEDMEKQSCMDRLICGDVGFGKTEVAIRAAFKAAADSKQVVVLVPTTLLAFQHYKSFSKRLADFPVHIDYLNRFRSVRQRKEILNSLKSGKIDIIIGTHSLLNESIVYKDLGLLIIDEEHKFGVSAKEKLRSLKSHVDTLSLTATPIPRTLQFSLMAARDLSIIRTPPPNRLPIDTRIIDFDKDIIVSAIEQELERSGQVFFIHNRIGDIEHVANSLHRWLGNARIRVAHGRMSGKELEDLMMDFVAYRFDILVCTTLVESGLDVSNANTIFINKAQNFGLAELHQLRGRVGRANQKAYCYLISPYQNQSNELSYKRLQALERFSDLGSGFEIAMKDLEIRGAGNLLGPEQSGFISEMGFDAYQKILSEVMDELKEGDFKDVLQKEIVTASSEAILNTQIDTDFEILIPDNYVNAVQERLKLYQELSEIKSEKQLEDFSLQLRDRFGVIPKSTKDLLQSIRLKWMAQKIGFEKLILKNGVMLCYVSPKMADNQELFTSMMQYVANFPKLFKIKELRKNEQTQLLLRTEQIDDIEAAFSLLEHMLRACV